MIEVSGLITSFNALYDMSKALLSLRDLQKLNATVIELQNVILTAQQQALTVQQGYAALEAKTRDLEAECMRLKDWSAEKENYTVRQIARGVFAYVDKHVMGDLTGEHKYCCNCFDRGEKSILQKSSGLGNEYFLLCPRCNFKVFVN